MSVLRRKLLRDLWHARGPVAAIAAMMMTGVALFVALRSMHGHLRRSQADYYARYAFADLFLTVRRAPRSLEDALRQVPGVADLDLRVVAQVVLDVPGSDAVVTGRLVSIPNRPGPMLNALHLVRGRYPEPGSHAEVAVSAAFARANRLDVGDTLGAVINGRRERLFIAALALSPEYIYEIPGGATILPDARRFGVLWVPERLLATGFDMEGAFNDAVFALERGANPLEVADRIDRYVDPYGGLGAYSRDEQLSHEFVSSEIEETRVTSVLIPSIFLGVTAFMLYLVTSRLVATEREQIAVLKAFGFSNARVLGHYTSFVLAPVAAGMIAGLALGVWLAHLLAGLYERFFQFPAAEFRPDPAVLGLTIGVAGAAALAGGVAAVRSVLMLPPAAAMQPPAPPRFRPGPLERLGLTSRLAPGARSVLRGLERRPWRALLTIFGLSLGYAIIVAGWYAFDALDVIEATAFHEADRSDLTVTFREPAAGRVRYALERLPGVTHVELFRAAPVRLRSGHRTERTGLLGLPIGGELRRLVEPPAVVHPIPEHGVLLTGTLATSLAVGRGARIEAQVLEGSRPVATLFVAGVVNEVLGAGVYMDRDRLNELLGERDVASGALLAVTRESRGPLARALEQLPAIGGVAERAATLAAFDRTIAESFRISLVAIVGFAWLLAGAVVYNSGRIALSERARELASLRVLGFTPREVTAMLLGEQALLTLLSLPVGALIGYGLCRLMTVRFATDLFRLPLVVDPRTYAMAAVVIAVAALATGGLVRQRVYALDLVGVLKARE